MKIELFMRSLDQDFSDDSTSEYSGMNYNNKSHRQRSYEIKAISTDRFLNDVKLREESFGGMLYDLRTKAVFSLDQEAFVVINDLVNGENFDALVSKNRISNENALYLKNALRKYNLCTN